ncbi:MAG: M14 family zinc carboxypeptidase [Candidatus Aminicenantaceae bacterium]
MAKNIAYGVIIAAAILIVSGQTGLGAEEKIRTPGEASNFTQYTQHEDIVRFLSRLDHLSPELEVRIVGRTLPVQNYGAKDIFLCILTEEGAGSPDSIDRSKPTFFLVAAKHGNEQSAKEAALGLVRDLAVGELRPLLRDVNVLVLPTANPYGNALDQRSNEQGLDLNRDQVKLESPETEAINRVFFTWMPEVTLDVHEKGDDYYRVSIGCVSNVNIHGRLQDFERGVLLVETAQALAARNITFHEYLITQAMGIDSSAGVSYGREDTAGRQQMKRFSTTDLNDGRNSLGIYETLSFIQEGASRHDLATLEERTGYQYFGIRFLLESAARHGQEINALVRGLRSELEAKASVYTEDDLVHLRMRYASDPGDPILTIQEYRRSRSPIRGILTVDKKAGDPLTAADIRPNPSGAEYQLIERVVDNWFPLVEPTLSVERPLGYIVPALHQDVIETLVKHGLELHLFTTDFTLETEAYQIADIVSAQYDYLPPEKIVVENTAVMVVAKRGDIYVPCAQPAANLIPCLLEPQSQYGLIRYWMYRLVPEKGDVFPFLRVTKPGDLPLIPYRSWR